MFVQLTDLAFSRQELPLLLADLDAGTLFYVVVGLLAAVSSWISKRKEAAKRAEFLESDEEEYHYEPEDGEPQASTTSGGGWLDKLESMVEEAEARVEKTAKPDLPPIIAAPVQEGEQQVPCPECGVSVFENRLESHIENVHRKPLPPPVFQDRPLEEQLQPKKPAPLGRQNPSPVYSSPIYSANIGQQIANDLNAARQGVVASIILNPPKALEDPAQTTRY